MIGLAAFGILALFWVGFIALTKREKGWVGISPATRARIRLFAAMARFQFVVGDAFVPALKRMTREMVKVNEAISKTRQLTYEEEE